MAQSNKIEKARHGVPRKGAHGMAPDIPDAFFAASHNYVDQLKTALDHVDVNSRTDAGLTILHCASTNAAMGAIHLLLSRPDLDATLVDDFGRNASQAALEVLGAAGIPVAEKLRPYCYPEMFAEIEKNLAKEKPGDPQP